ncbi:MAG: hypothetical protein JXA82_18195 [Sedimentisphaerales bacterium]|nr:hypothetical protein [Sedimentisphaerales bacterium]
MSRYAKNTSVSVDRSEQEIRRELTRFGASRFATMHDIDNGNAAIGFEFHGRRIQMTVTMPNRDDEEFTLTDTGRERNENAAFKAYETACRQRWRSLALVIKAKLVAVDDGVATFEDEFLPYTVLPNGQTISQIIQPRMERVLSTGKLPPLLTGA